MAGQETIKTGTTNVIKFGAIKQVLESYGRFRLDDVSREHRHQCEAISDIVNAFVKQPTLFATRNLLDFIDARIIPCINVEIDGKNITSSLEVAQFLYRIGFLLGVDREHGGSPEYYQFEERPELLKNKANIDSGMKWLVHPSFHTALSLSNS